MHSFLKTFTYAIKIKIVCGISSLRTIRTKWYFYSLTLKEQTGIIKSINASAFLYLPLAYVVCEKSCFQSCLSFSQSVILSVHRRGRFKLVHLGTPFYFFPGPVGKQAVVLQLKGLLVVFTSIHLWALPTVMRIVNIMISHFVFWMNRKGYQEHSQSANKAAHSGFETQRRRHQKSKRGASVAPKMDMCPPKIKKQQTFEVQIIIQSST